MWCSGSARKRPFLSWSGLTTHSYLGTTRLILSLASADNSRLPCCTLVPTDEYYECYGRYSIHLGSVYSFRPDLRPSGSRQVTTATVATPFVLLPANGFRMLGLLSPVSYSLSLSFRRDDSFTLFFFFFFLFFPRRYSHLDYPSDHSVRLTLAAHETGISRSAQNR